MKNLQSAGGAWLAENKILISGVCQKWADQRETRPNEEFRIELLDIAITLLTIWPHTTRDLTSCS
jgi:hypothetical protein